MEECTLHLYANTVEPVKKFAIGLYGQKVSVEIHPEEYQGWTIVTFKLGTMCFITLASCGETATTLAAFFQ